MENEMCELFHVVDDEGTNEENPHTQHPAADAIACVTL